MRENNGRFFRADPATAFLCQQLAKAGFNPDEPRGDQARWTRDGGKSESNVSSVAYQGYFHDFVVKDFLEGLRANGSKFLDNVRIIGVNGFIAIPDGLSQPKNSNAYFIEMKTGGE